LGSFESQKKIKHKQATASADTFGISPSSISLQSISLSCISPYVGDRVGEPLGELLGDTLGEHSSSPYLCWRLLGEHLAMSWRKITASF
jgi:hypothetical protein